MSASLSESHPMLIYMLLVLENLADIFRLCQWLIIFAVKKKKKEGLNLTDFNFHESQLWAVSDNVEKISILLLLIQQKIWFCFTWSIYNNMRSMREKKRERKKKERKKEDEGQTVPVWDLGFLAVTLSTSLSWQIIQSCLGELLGTSWCSRHAGSF